MAVLVTGGTGFVGIHVVRVLARAGHDVIVYDANGPDRLAQGFLDEASARVSFLRGDIRDREAVRRAVADEQVDALVHMAAITAAHPDVERARGAETVEVNVLGTVAALEAARARPRPLRRLVHVSSGSIYGPCDQRIPIPETAPANPAAIYPISKLAGEQVARRYGEIHGLPVAVVRLTLPFGPMERDTGARSLLSPFPGWLRAARAGEELAVAALDEGRDYTYAEDVARGIVAVLDAPRLSHPAYNIGNGVRYTMHDVVEAFRAHFPDLRYRVAPDEESVRLALGPRTARGPLDPTRLMNDCGYRPSFSLQSGLAAYVAWRRSMDGAA